MSAVNVTVRIDEESKKEFDRFCGNVGMNITTAINMFIKATLRTRQLPFPVTDHDTYQKQAKSDLIKAMVDIQESSARNGTDKMTIEEINAEIATNGRGF